MFGTRGKREQRNRGSGGDPPVRSNFPSQTCTGPRIFPGREQTPAGQTECERRISMRRHGPRLVSLFIFVGAALIASCSTPFHEKNERYVFVATNIDLPYWQEGRAGGFYTAEQPARKAEQH